MFLPRRLGKSRAVQIFTNAQRAARGLPHRGAKEAAKRYAEVRHPYTGHTTICRVA